MATPIKYLTEVEAAARWPMSVHWFRRMRWAGGGPEFLKIGAGRAGKVLYPEESTDAFFASKLRKSTSDTGN